MKVKIGNTWHDSKDEPICIEVSEKEQKHIGEMDREASKLGRYASFPEVSEMSEAEMFNWMRE